MQINPFFIWLLQPFSSGRYRNISRAAVYLGATFIVCILLALAIELAALNAPVPQRHQLIELSGNLALIALLSAIVGAMVLVRDTANSPLGGSQPRDREALSTLQQREADAARSERNAAVRRDLQVIYDKHHESLVDEARKRLQPDRYGQRDTAAAAREFSYFQESVATSELTRRGYLRVHIEEAFEVERDALLLTILRAI